MSKNKQKKTSYKVIAEALASGQLKNVPLSTTTLNARRLGIDEIKTLIREAFEDAKAASDVEAEELNKGWGDADIENEVNWVKSLKIKEFLDLAEKEDK